MKARGFFLILLAVLFFQSMSAWAQTSSLENELISYIRKDPNSSLYRYNYILFLYQEERFSEAQSQLDSLYKIDPAHEEGKVVGGSIEIVSRIRDSLERKKAMYHFVLPLLSGHLNTLHQSLVY